MRIALVTLHWPRTFQSGIGKKIQSQISAWRSAGHETQYFMHLHDYFPKGELIPANYFIYPFNRNLVAKEKARIAALKELIDQVTVFKPDIIYLRWAMYVFPLHQLFKIAPVVVEINTNDVHEHSLLGFSFNIYNRLTRGLTLRRASGFVCITNELLKSYDFTKYDKPSVVVSNGIVLSEYSVYPPPTNQQPRLLFIGTPGLPWQGIEKLADLAANFADLQIVVIGYDAIPGVPILPKNMQLLGYLQGGAFQKEIAHSDAAIGTLALYRKGMQEAAPLKIRECLAYGLPVILPYQDTDLDDLEIDTILKIPNNEKNIENYGQEIHDFAFRVKGKRIPSELIQAKIDSHEKEKNRLEFFEKILKIGPKI